MRLDIATESIEHKSSNYFNIILYIKKSITNLDKITKIFNQF